jgi:hypothetical protein
MVHHPSIQNVSAMMECFLGLTYSRLEQQALALQVSVHRGFHWAAVQIKISKTVISSNQNHIPFFKNLGTNRNSSKGIVNHQSN